MTRDAKSRRVQNIERDIGRAGNACRPHALPVLTEQDGDFNLPVGQPFQIAPVILTAPMPPSEGYR